MADQNKNSTFYGKHDEFFRRIYSLLEFAKDLIELGLSKKTQDLIDIDQIQQKSERFGVKTVDLMFSAPFKEIGEEDCKLFILIEHKSSCSPKELFRQILSYLCGFYQQSLSKSKTPQPLIPLVFYHGKSSWKGEGSFQEVVLREVFTKLGVSGFSESRSMLNCELCFVNLCDPRVQLEIQRRKLKTGCFLLLLGRIWELRANEWKGLKEILVLVGKFCNEQDLLSEEEVLLMVWEYLESMGMSEHQSKELEEELVSEGVFKKGVIMNIREAILERGKQEGHQKGIQEGIQKGRMEGLQEGIQQGIQKGMHEGREEGLQEGRQEERLEMVLNMLKKDAEISFISDVTGLSEGEIKKLKNGSMS